MTPQSPTPTPIRVSRLSVASIMESVQIREGVEALDRHRVRVLYAIGIAFAARLFMAAYSTQTIARSGGDISNAVPEVGLAILAYFVALWFMALRGRDRFGFGIALGVAVIEATTQLVSLARIATTSPIDTSAAWPMLVILAAHLFLAYAAFQASLDFPSESSSRPWVLGFLISVLFTVAVPSLRQRVARGGVYTPERVLTRATAPSPSLSSALSVVNRCAKAFADSASASGYPRALEELGPNGSRCITDTLTARGQGTGWMFTYSPDAKDASGRTPGYTILARQGPRSGMGVGFFESDEKGEVHTVGRPTR